MQGKYKSFPLRETRDGYVEKLTGLLGVLREKEDLQYSVFTEEIEKYLENAINQISPSAVETDTLFNNMQLTALIALEAAFFKCISSHEDANHEKLKLLHSRLYGAGSKFQARYSELKNKTIKEYSVNSTEILSNPSADPYNAKLDFQRQCDSLFSNRKEVILLPGRNTDDIVKFLSSIDPHFLAYTIINLNQVNKLSINVKKPNILHEAIIATKILCNTILDIGLLVVPPIALGLGAFIFAEVSLPLSIGIVLLSFAVALETKQIFDQSAVYSIINDTRQTIDRKINNPNADVSLVPEKFSSPMQLFDIKNILSSIITYVINCYRKNKAKFQHRVPEICKSLDELIKKGYAKYLNSEQKNTDHNTDEMHEVRTYVESIFAINTKINKLNQEQDKVPEKI
jgi:hypothetical protein